MTFIERQSLDYLLQTHNNMYRLLQKYPKRSNIIGTASRIEERLRAHGTVMLGEVRGGGSINIQMSAPVPAPAPAPVQTQIQVQQPPQQNIVVHQQVQQQHVIYHQQVLPQPQPNVVYQQQQQPQVLNLSAPVATLTVTSTPVHNFVIGGIGTPRIGYVRSPRSFGGRGFFDYDSDSD